MTGEADVATWRALYNAYRGYLLSLPPNYFGVSTRIYPGSPLVLGSSGADVSAIQEYLNFISNTYTEIPKLTVDGIYGAGTANAVRVYQSLFGINPSGIVASTTWNAITDTYRSLYEGQYGSSTQFGGEISQE